MVKYYLSLETNGNDVEATLCQRSFETMPKDEKKELKAKLDAELKEAIELINIDDTKNDDEKKKAIKDATKENKNKMAEANAKYKKPVDDFNKEAKENKYKILPASLNAIVKKVLGNEDSYKLLDDEYTKLLTLSSADVQYRNSKLNFEKAVKNSIYTKKLLEKGFTEAEIKSMKNELKETKKAVNTLK